MGFFNSNGSSWSLSEVINLYSGKKLFLSKNEHGNVGFVYHWNNVMLGMGVGFDPWILDFAV